MINTMQSVYPDDDDLAGQLVRAARQKHSEVHCATGEAHNVEAMTCD